jgi:hypothetical protein
MRLAAGIIAVTMTISAVGNGADLGGDAEFYKALGGALADMGMTIGDFRIRHDYAEPDVFRLSLVDSLMHNPADLMSSMDGLAARIEQEPGLPSCAFTLWDAMSVEPTSSTPAPAAASGIKDIAGRLVHLSPPFGRIVEGYLGGLERMAALRGDALSEVEADLDHLYSSIPRMLAPSPEYEGTGWRRKTRP